MIPRHNSIGEGVLSPTEPVVYQDIAIEPGADELFRVMDEVLANLLTKAIVEAVVEGVPDVFGGGLTTGEIVWTPQAIAAHFQVHPGRVDFEVGE